jgi:hypothetical protein
MKKRGRNKFVHIFFIVKKSVWSGKKSNKEISIKNFQMLHHVVYVNLTFPEYSKWKEFLMAPPPKNSVITRIEKILKILTMTKLIKLICLLLNIEIPYGLTDHRFLGGCAIRNCI